MNDSDDLKPTEKEIAMLRALRADPSLAEAVEQLARISDDKDPQCYSADEAEEKIHALGREAQALQHDRMGPERLRRRSCMRKAAKPYSPEPTER